MAQRRDGTKAGYDYPTRIRVRQRLSSSTGLSNAESEPVASSEPLEAP